MAHRTDLRLRAYQAGDEARFTPREDFAAEMKINAWDWARGPPPGRCWAIVRGSGEVIGLAGLEDLGDGCWWSAWAILADLPPREIVAAMALGEAAIRYLEVSSRPAAQICARARTPAAARCLGRLSFQDVGVEHYAAAGDYRVMVRA